MFDGSNDGKLVLLFLGDLVVSTNGKVFGFDEGIKLVLFYGKFLGTVLGNVYWITLVIDVGTDLVSLNGYLGGSNDGKLEGLFPGVKIRSTDSKVLVSGEGIKLGSDYGKVIGDILVNVDVITPGIDVAA